jgi:lipoprotein-anchoring transpeptidase ErfK/SrfK
MLVTASALALTGCTGGLSAPAASSATTTAAEAAASAEVSSSPSAVTSTTSTPAPPPLTISTTPQDTATEVSVLEPVLISVPAGTLTDATVTNPDGKQVQGVLSADATTWTSTEPLGYGKTYQVTATAVDAGRTITQTSSFTTVQPTGVIFPSFEPPPDRGQVGIGQPLSVIFDKPPADKAAAERALSVTSEPAVEGSWSWVDERTVHYRPREYWPAGTKITLAANVYGVDLGGGMYGETDRSMSLTIGPAKVATVDNATKQMTVSIDGQVVRTYPISLGRDESTVVDGKEISFVTPSGIYVAQEKYDVKQMSSATYGLPTDFELGYDSAIPLAVRLSNSGIFAHSAPWSVADQGLRNVSHGCINMPPADAQWFYDTFGFGDIVQVTGTSTQLAPDDGYGDWNIPWEQWVAGSALS